MTPSTSSSDESLLTAGVFIEAAYDAVWWSFTRATAYTSWHSAPCLEFGRLPGDPVVWGTADRVVYRGTLERIEKGRGLTYTFQFVGFGFDEPTTTVAIDIVEHAPTVLVSLRHDCTGAPRTRELIGPYGWLKSLSRLKTLLETGHSMPWPGESAQQT